MLSRSMPAISTFRMASRINGVETISRVRTGIFNRSEIMEPMLQSEPISASINTPRRQSIARSMAVICSIICCGPVSKGISTAMIFISEELKSFWATSTIEVAVLVP